MDSRSLLNLWIVGIVFTLLLLTLYTVGSRLMDSKNKYIRSIGDCFYITSYMIGICFGMSFGIIALVMTVGWIITTVVGV